MNRNTRRAANTDVLSGGVGAVGVVVGVVGVVGCWLLLLIILKENIVEGLEAPRRLKRSLCRLDCFVVEW